MVWHVLISDLPLKLEPEVCLQTPSIRQERRIRASYAIVLTTSHSTLLAPASPSRERGKETALLPKGSWMQILGIATPVPTAKQLSRSFPEVFQAPRRTACLAPALLGRTRASAGDPSAGERLANPEGRRLLLGAPLAPLHPAMDARCQLLSARRRCAEAGG